MTKSGLVKFFLLFLITSSAFGQKVKYKDIFALLNSKQYEQAEPFLRKYLKENVDNPNAYLFMGLIFQEKSAKSDVLKATKASIATMDSAIYFYDKTLKLLTEKEVRRNDEYYQMYNRRDLRTGEFGVALSTIQFDLQKRIEGLKERTDRVKMVKYHFTLADSLYKKSNTLYKKIQSRYPGLNELYLRSTDELVAELTALSVRFDSCQKAFEMYKGSTITLGKTGYNQILAVDPIVNFKTDGSSLVSFFDEDLHVWNYKKFADDAKVVIEKEILPMRQHLISYDVEINKLREKLTSDSVSVKTDLTKVIDKILYDQLRKFDKEPLPMEVFTMKTAELEYKSALIEHKPFRDSTDVTLRLTLAKKEMKELSKLDSICTRLTAQDFDKEVVDYEKFVTDAYGNPTVLKLYIKSLKDYSEREKDKKQKEITRRIESQNWIVDQLDSIPLLTEKANRKFKPLAIVPEKFTVGLSFADTTAAKGYFYTIKSSRRPEVRVPFEVDKTAFRYYKVPSTKALTFSDPAGQIYFVLVYSERAAKDKYPATLAKIYRSDGLAWANNIQMTFVPKEIVFSQNTGELTLKGETLSTVVDKNGKVLTK